MNRAEPIQRRALKNTLIGGASFVASAGLNFISVPICLRAWGNDRYGVWLALVAGFLILRTIDSGYVNYVGNQLNVLYHEDRERMRQTLAATLKICLGLSFLELTVWAWMAWSGTLHSLLGVDATNVERHDLGSALGIMVFGSLLTGPLLGIIHRLYIPVGLMYLAGWWALGLLITQAVAQMCAAWLGATIFQAALLYAFLQAAISLAAALNLRRLAPELTPWWQGGNFKVGVRDFVRSIALTANGAGQQATTSGVVLFVSSVFGAGTVPVFTTVRTLANLWSSLSTVFSTPLLPEIVRFHATNEHDKLFKAFRAHWFFSGTIVNGSMIVSLPFVRGLYSVWTHGSLRFESALFICSLASLALVNFGSVLNVYLAGINSLAAQLITTIVRASIVFGLGAMVMRLQGLSGLGVVLLGAELICSVGLGIYFTNRELERFDLHLPMKGLSLAFLQTVPIQVLGVMSLLSDRVYALSSAIAFMAFGFVAWLNWRGLDSDVKERVRQLARRKVRPA